MLVDLVNAEIQYKDRETIIKGLLYLKLLQKDIKLTDNELGVLSVVAFEELKTKVIEKCIEKGYIKSVQSGENSISKMVNMGLLKKISSGVRVIDPEYLPSLSSNYIGATLKLHNFASQ